LRLGLQTWFNRYNHWRPHENLGNLTPAHVYHATTPKAA
jgi:transposase InsO family protein